MIMKKTGLVIAAAAAAIMLSGCATGARNAPDNMPVCETPCVAPSAAPCNSCKGMSACKQMCPPKHHKKRHHRRCKTEMTNKEMPNNS